MKKVFLLIIIAAVSALLLKSCKKDNGEPPEVPVPGTMSIDFSNFESGKKGTSHVLVPKGTLISNWEFAAEAAIIWKSIINSSLIIPVTAFEMASSQTPVSIGNNTWQWSYSVTVLTVTYKAKLTGQVAGSNVQWKMYITKEGADGYSDFVWFTGTSKSDRTSGQWVMYQNPQNPVELLRIDWTQSGETVGTVKFTHTKSGDPFKESYIEYGLKTGTLNAYYNIHYYNSLYQQFYDLNVEWSTTQHNGRVKCEKYFGNTDWYCWDGNFLNVTC